MALKAMPVSGSSLVASQRQTDDRLVVAARRHAIAMVERAGRKAGARWCSMALKVMPMAGRSSVVSRRHTADRLVVAARHTAIALVERFGRKESARMCSVALLLKVMLVATRSWVAAKRMVVACWSPKARWLQSLRSRASPSSRVEHEVEQAGAVEAAA